ncbi:alpha/beta hydrolase fold domain-containing protein [Roseivivax sediminis]|uniref:Acetyl esterase n=1 Tax=Roseivivax sediminis TaxID=936889 RepID=A0A1I1XAC1_9RHOB|nr:alpha/beta hydrolase fold domain-containing protein [Roseivivax sediminis]SFE04101.1 acetyl esterase [Roseivivax sediminis]
MTGPSPNMQAVLDQLAAEDAGLADPTTLPSQHGRALADLTNLRWNADLPPVREARTVMHAGLPGRWIVPENDTGTDAILHVHGGGWAFCSVATHEGASRRLANACGCPVLTVDYRLAPEHPYPAGLEDILRAWWGCDPARRWSLAGDSAGANLALAAALRLAAMGEAPPATLLLFYGVYGADFETESYRARENGPGLTRAKMMRYWDWYAPTPMRDDPCVAPVVAADAALAALPPLYLNAAGLDPLLSDTEQLVARLRDLGRDDRFDRIEGVVHGFMQMGTALPEARSAFERAGAAFRDITSTAAQGGTAQQGGRP